MNRALSITDTMDTQRVALHALRALEAEIILLLSLPEETRDKLIRLVESAKQEFVAAIAAAQLPAQLPLTRKGGLVVSSSSAAPSTMSSPSGFQRTIHKGFGKRVAEPRWNNAVSPAGSSPRREKVVTPPESSIREEDEEEGGGDDDGQGEASLPTASQPFTPSHRKKSSPAMQRATPPPPKLQLGGGLTSPRKSAVPQQLDTSLEGSVSVVATAITPDYGHCITAALYMILEGILVGCQADRLALYCRTVNGGGLQLACTVGIGMGVAKRGVMASPVGLIHAVFNTKIAANLDQITYEDVAECPGPTPAKNAILFPVFDNTTDRRDVVGVVILVNKQRGTRAFTLEDEQLLHTRLPAIAYIVSRYSFDFSAFGIDPAPLHRLAPLQVWAPSSCEIPQRFASAPAVQKVFHRNGEEKFIRRQALSEARDVVTTALATSESLQSVEAYIAVLEDCWRRGIEDRVEVEMTLRQKMSHLSDAREILIRKQRKFEILKETLCEQLEKQVADVTRGGGNLPRLGKH